MPKRFWSGPLGLHDDDWLTVWAVLNNRSKSAQATSVLAARIRDRKSVIQEMLDYTAGRMGLEPEELMRQILFREIGPGDLDVDGEIED